MAALLVTLSSLLYAGAFTCFPSRTLWSTTTSTLFYANDDFAVQTRDFVGPFNSTSANISRKRELIWQERYQELTDFYTAYGHTNVPNKYCRRLSKWVGNQRQNFRRGDESLTQERIEALEAINFDWNCNSASFYRMIEKLRDYKAIHGHLNISRNNIQDVKLADFLSTQRHNYKLYTKGEKSSLTRERLAILKDLGVDFNTKEGLSASWMKMFEQLLEFYRQNGHSKVPQLYEENPKLGAWVHSQRAQYRLLKNGKKSNLNNSRIELLKSVDFMWGVVRRDHQEAKQKLQEDLLIEAIKRLKQNQQIEMTRRLAYYQDAEALLAEYKKKSLWGR